MAKNPLLAAFLSFLLPGLGEIYTGKVLMGIGLILISIIISTLAILLTLFAAILYIIVWLYAIYDSYMTAKAANEAANTS